MKEENPLIDSPLVISRDFIEAKESNKEVRTLKVVCKDEVIFDIIAEALRTEDGTVLVTIRETPTAFEVIETLYLENLYCKEGESFFTENRSFVRTIIQKDTPYIVSYNDEGGAERILLRIKEDIIRAENWRIYLEKWGQK